MNTSHKKLLKENYEKACNAYVGMLAEMWEWDTKSYGYWVGDEVDGIYSYGEFVFIDMQDIIFCVENNINASEYEEWQEYCLFANEYKQNVPNLKAWHKGCPRLSKDAQKHLVSLKERFDKAIKDYKDNTTINY
jgi:hypothetical protein